MLSKLRIATLILIAVSLAMPTVAFAEEEAPERHRLRFVGEITDVVPGQGTFTLHTRAGEDLEFQTNERTRFRSPDGSVKDIHDLKKGMMALVVAIRAEDGLQALVVAAGKPRERPERVRVIGEITGVVPGQGTFTLLSQAGEEFEFTTSDRTRFRSRDGSIEDIHDLEKGMHAIVAAIETEQGDLLALLVAAGHPEDLPSVDVRALGKIAQIDDRSFVLETRDGRMTFQVTDKTVFRGVGSFDELEVGMIAAVGANETDDGMAAVFVAARAAPADRPSRDPSDRPNRKPEGPAPDDISQGLEV